MRIISFIALLLLGLFFIESANAQGWQWGRGSNGGVMDSWVTVTDPSGNVFVGGSGSGFSGNPLMFGADIIPFIPGYSQEVIISKYDGAGNFLWANATQSDFTYLMSITTDQFGNSFLLCDADGDSFKIGKFSFANTQYPDRQYFLTKIDPLGNILWVKMGSEVQYGGDTYGALMLGGGGLATDAIGNIYVSASFQLPNITIWTAFS